MFLRLDNLRKMYSPDNGLKALSLDVAEGSFVTLLGPSGCGKTTTLNLIGGFLRADSGRILLEGADITKLPPESRPVSTVFQSYALFPHLNVLENVAYGLRFQRKMRKRAALNEARTYLEIVGLQDYADARVGNLSGGQQQRVALARSMATNPKILLLDEPFSNLDAGLRGRMRAELKDLQRQLGITMIFVTHDQEEALCLSDRIVVMEAGEAVQIGSPHEVYFQPGSEYVSSFIGKSNLLRRDGKTILVRPEDIRMSRAENGHYTITGAVFMGAHTEYRLYDGQTKLEVDLSGFENSAFQPGERVEVEILRALELA